MVPLMNKFLLISFLQLCQTFPDDIYKPNYRYIEEGDINIGAILSVHPASSLMKCSEEVQDANKIQNIEALHFAVREINNRSDILPKLKLGFVALDDCHSSSIALSRAIQFMPYHIRSKGIPNIITSKGAPNVTQTVAARDKVFYDVAGIIGPYTSELSIVVANVLNLFRLPQISQTATSDVLSDKTRFPYFFRMVPPDRYQVQVIAMLLQYFNWTHISILYSEGSYGREGLKKLRQNLRDTVPSVCIEDSIEISYNSNRDNLQDILNRLKSSENVKVVVAFVELEDAVSLSKALRSAKLEGRFVWLGSDGISTILGEQPERCLAFPSSLVVQPQSGKVERFRNYLTGLRAGLFQSSNPWLKGLIEHTSHSYVPQELKTHWQLNKNYEDHFKPSFAESYIIDSVYAFAHALDNVVKNNCSDMHSKAEIVGCVKEVGILAELKSLQFNGSYGRVKFNAQGDVLSKYVVRQCINIGSRAHYGTHRVGCWDMYKERLFLNEEKLFWPDNAAPRSACSEPCLASIGKIYHFTQQTCCWECLSCKQNEIVTENLTRCESCPNIHWPDDSRISCLQIMPFYMSFIEPVAIGLGAAATAGIIACLLIGTALIKYRDEQVIKCTSVELSFMVLVGAFTAYCLPLSFLSEPNTYKCYINHVGFSLTFTIVYAPLLVKTNRIYRIFKAGRRTTRKPWCISKGSQILISIVLITFQVAIVIISTSLRPPEVKKEMPVKMERFVELFCDLPIASLLSSLSYNLVLVFICTVYAFKTRKLPDNFKESRYISYCVDTTLLIWITFLPTYFTTSRADAKVTIMAVALLLNASVTITCLFVPRFLSLYKTRTNTHSPSSHHYKDFRIVKHVVTRKRSMEYQIREKNSEIQTHRVSSAVTITSDITAQDVNDVILAVAKEDSSETMT